MMKPNLKLILTAIIAALSGVVGALAVDHDPVCPECPACPEAPECPVCPEEPVQVTD